MTKTLFKSDHKPDLPEAAMTDQLPVPGLQLQYVGYPPLTGNT